MDDFIQLKPQSNVYEAETMVEGERGVVVLVGCVFHFLIWRMHICVCVVGTLEGFSFDSEDEAANRQTGDENKGADAADPQTKTNGKGKGKAEKTSSVSVCPSSFLISSILFSFLLLNFLETPTLDSGSSKKEGKNNCCQKATKEGYQESSSCKEIQGKKMRRSFLLVVG